MEALHLATTATGSLVSSRKVADRAGEANADATLPRLTGLCEPVRVTLRRGNDYAGSLSRLEASPEECICRQGLERALAALIARDLRSRLTWSGSLSKRRWSVQLATTDAGIPARRDISMRSRYAAEHDVTIGDPRNEDH